MTNYNVTAWCDRPFYTQFEVEAETPERALAITKERANDEPAEECDDGYCWDQFRICDAEDNSLLTHLEGQALLLDSAAKLLTALKAILPYARNEAEGLETYRGEDEVAARQADDAWKAVEQAEALLAGLTAGVL